MHSLSYVSSSILFIANAKQRSTHDNHLGGLEDEAFVGSPGAATRPLPEAATAIKAHFSIKKIDRIM